MPNLFGYTCIAICIVIVKITVCMFIPIGVCMLLIPDDHLSIIYSKTLREKTFTVREESYSQKTFTVACLWTYIFNQKGNNSWEKFCN